MAKPKTQWSSANNKNPTSWNPQINAKPKNSWNPATAKPATTWTKATKNDTSWNKLAFGLIPYIYDSPYMTYDDAARYYDGIPAAKTPQIWTNI